jgi:predicted GH43/DUF377 family glycosyl hydrolase
MAKSLGKDNDYRRFMKRAGNYRNLWNPDLGWMWVRSRKGNWAEPTDILRYGKGWIESNAAQFTWFVPHDPQGLINLIGSREAFREKLDASFKAAAEHDFVSGKSHSVETLEHNRRVYINYGNQPAMQTAFLFNYAGAPWLTQYWSRQVVEKVYSGLSPEYGYSGDEDQGLMGSLAVLMKMGLFSMQGGTNLEPVYELGSPVFDKITIKLNQDYYPGREFVLETINNSRENLYIQSASLNDRPLDRAWFYHKSLVAGGKLELEMGPEPNKSWGSHPAVAPPSMSSPKLFQDFDRKGRPFAKDPSVIRFKDKYWMYYSLPPAENAGKSTGTWSIGIASSTDLEHWIKVGELQPDGSYESKGMAAPCAKVIEGKIHLFYQTYGNAEKDAICHAWSEDGINFTRNETNPVFAPTGNWNVGRAIDADVYIYKNQAYLYWASRDPEYKRQFLGVAVAPLKGGFRRESWQQLSQEPLLQPELSWEMNCVEAPSVFRENDRWYMFYAGAYNHEGQQIGLATSDDGVQWRRLSEVPVLAKGGIDDWNSWESGHPGVFIDPESGRKWLFYQGNPDQGHTYYLSSREFKLKDDLVEWIED